MFFRFLVLFLVVCMFLPNVAFLQTTLIVNNQNNNCSFTNNLYLGLYDYNTAGAISRLQRVLVSYNFLSQDSITGYFGPLTRAAVQKYQALKKIDQTGYVGPLTRESLGKENCSVENTNTINQNIPGYFDREIRLSSLSVNSGPIGSFVTIKGSGFDKYNNTVIFGSVAIGDLSSEDGKSVTFAVPQPRYVCAQYSSSGCNNDETYINAQNGKYNIYVTNSKGISNYLTFTLTSSIVNTTTRPSISRVIGPSQLRTGVTGLWALVISDSVSRPLIASVKWDKDIASQSKNLYSIADTQVLTFNYSFNTVGRKSISFTLTDDDNPNLRDTYSTYVTVSTSSQQRSNIVSLSSITPSRVKIGSTVVLSGEGFSNDGNNVYFGAGVIKNIPSYNNGTLIFFQIPSYINPCDAVVVGSCNAPIIQITPGSYNIYVINNNNQQSQTRSVTIPR